MSRYSSSIFGDSLRIGTTMERSGVIEEVAIIRSLARNCLFLGCAGSGRLRAHGGFVVGPLAPHRVADPAHHNEAGEPQTHRLSILRNKRQRLLAPEHREYRLSEVSDAPPYGNRGNERAHWY